MMEINLPTARHTLTADGSLVPSGSIVTVSNLPILDTNTGGTTYLPFLRDGTILGAIPTSQGLVIATGPDGTGAVILDSSHSVAVLAQTAHAGMYANLDVGVNITPSEADIPKDVSSPVDAQATPNETDIRPPVGKGPFKCDICDKVFPKWNQLRRHSRSHADDKPFRCSECSVTFNMESNLLLHQATHNVDDPKCPECDKKFSRIASLKAHIMLHEREESLTCVECGDEFTTQNQLDRHAKVHREEMEAKVYTCRQCTQEFTKASLLREHIKAHYRIKASLTHRVYKRNVDRSSFNNHCETCGKTFQKPSQLERHIRIHTGERPYKCNQCDKAFNQKGALQIHQTKHSGIRPHRCQFCPAAFSQKGNLRAHIQRVHTIAKTRDQPVYQCEDCSCIFRKLGSLNAHMSRMHSEEALSTGSQREHHSHDEEAEETTEGNQAESLVPENSGNAAVKEAMQKVLELSDKDPTKEVTDSVQVQEEEEVQDDAVSNSDILQQALENSGLAASVDERCLNNSSKEPVGQSFTVNRPGVTGTSVVADVVTGCFKKYSVRKIGNIRWHQCMYCTKEFKKPSDLVRHIRIHTHEKPYKCVQCFRAFAVKSTLTAHIRTHSGVKTYQCDNCDKMFSTHGSLKVHVRLHTGAKPFDCPHCDKRFRTSGHRKSHILSHFKDSEPKRSRKPSKHTPKNDITFPDVQLQPPILITESGLIQQSSRNNLFSEFVSSSGGVERPYRCSTCSRGFKKSSHLKQHVRSHTGEKPFRCPKCLRSFVSSGVLKAHLKTHDGIKAYKCVMCETSFTTNGSLKRHMSIHSENRPFMCPYCQKTFKTSVNCKKHMKTHKYELAMQAATGAVHDVVVTDEGTATALLEASEVPESVDEAGHKSMKTSVVVDEATNSTVTISHSELQQVISQENLATIQSTLTQDNLQQLTQSLSQEVFGETVLGQNGLTGQSTLLLDHQQAFTQAFEQFNSSNFNLQSDQLQNTLDLGNLGTAFVQTQQGADENTIVTGDIPNILRNDSEEILIEPQSDIMLVNQNSEEQQENIIPMMDVQTTTSGSRKFFRCSICDKTFKKSSHLKQHIRCHTGEKPYKCTHCSRTFGSNGVLKAHLRTHEGIKGYICQTCEARFTTNGSLTRHMMIHTSTRPFKCPQCPESFRTSIHFKRHLRLHRLEPGSSDSERPRRFRQAVIQLSDEHTMMLANQNPAVTATVSEKILHASAAEKDRVSEIKDKRAELEKLPKHAHKCERCPKSFKKPSDLVRHIRIHTGEKPFECPTCKKSFTVKSTLDSHMKTHLGEKHFSCHVCNSMFATKGSLKVHMRLHTGAKPFKCPHCELRFRTSGHRKSHISSHFKPAIAKRKKTLLKASEPEIIQESQDLDLSKEQATVNFSSPQATLTLGQINLDPSILQQNLIQAVSNVPLGQETLHSLDGAGHILQGQESIPIQLQLNGLLGQGVHVAGLDSGLLTQTIHIDAALLQQIQQQGNINITINPNILTQPEMGTTGLLADPTTILNQNIIIQQVAGLTMPVGDQQQVMIPINADRTDISSNQVTVDSLNKDFEFGLGSQRQLLSVERNEGITIHSLEESNEQVQIVDDNQDRSNLCDSQDDLPESLNMSVGSDNQSLLVEQPAKNSEVETEEEMDSFSDTRQDVEETRSHVCEVCKKGFKRASHLKDHLRLHVPRCLPPPVKHKSPFHVCPNCDKKFGKPSQLRRHLLIHTGERPYVCTECNKAFNQKNALKVHMKKHTGERPYKCNFCELAFTQKGNLKVHMKRAHNGQEVLNSEGFSHIVSEDDRMPSFADASVNETRCTDIQVQEDASELTFSTYFPS